MLLLVVLATGFALPEQHARSVTGRVTDRAGNVLPGSVVEIENTVTLGIQSYIVHEDGTYFFKELNPDVDFTLTAHYKRFWSKAATLSKFNTAKEAKINLTIPVD
jgi:hypothetical protein